MAERFVNRLTGSDLGTGTQQDPWFTVPGMTGGNAVTAGDVINVYNGQIYPGRLVLPANNLTYRGYGLASNVLTLVMPHWLAPDELIERRIVREPGVHEGMWILDGAGETQQGIINFGTRTGCVIEDACVINASTTSTGVSIGTSAQSQVGAVMRRSAVIGAVVGISVYRPDTQLEEVLVKDTSDDGVVLGTGVSQGSHAGRFFKLQRSNLINNGYNTGTAIGDAFQLFNSTGYQGLLVLEQNYVRRNSQVKQGFMMASIAGPVVIEANYFDGEQQGSTQLGIESIQAAGRVLVRRNCWRGVQTNGNPIIRIVDNSLDAGSVLDIDSNLVDYQQYAGLFSWGSSTGTLAGTVRVRNNTASGIAGNGLTWSAAIGLYTAGTISGSASAEIDNNLLIGASPVAFRLPTGGLNDSRWKFRGNFVDGAVQAGYLGAQGFGTAYDTVAALQAAHSHALKNRSGVSGVNARLRPVASSPLLKGGFEIGHRRDIQQRLSRSHVGAFGGARLLHLDR